MNKQVVIDRQFSGPPDSSNGGYACGVVGNHVKGAAEVTLRRAPPIEKILDIKKTSDNKYVLYDDDGIIAEATSTILELDVPCPPSFVEAQASTFTADQIPNHMTPILTSPFYCNCFVCGMQREEPDGLRLWPGPVEGEDYLATTWVPDVSFVDETGLIKNEVVWGALDCPSGWAILHEKHEKTVYGVLGRLAVQIHRRVRPGEKCVVCAWRISQEGRKRYGGCALFSEDAELLAKSKATWIELK